ncbi:hypothetical protein MPSEU_000015400 [Mayamaea pseudoterrestris]|nr:hypothetical protein MPSEU_000015400 [Mayamaea pseudoterrestris]
MQTPDKVASSGSSRGSNKRELEGPVDDFSLLLQHQDFPTIVSLAAMVKLGRQQYHSGGYSTTITHGVANRKPSHSGAPLQTDEVLRAVSTLQAKLLNAPPRTIARDVHPMTDILVDDIIKTLQRELQAMEATKRATTGTASTQVSPDTSRSIHGDSSNAVLPAIAKSGALDMNATATPMSGAPIATKYTKQQTDVLMTWMIHNVHQPFPTNADIQYLMQQTQLSHSQVVNWTTNVRKRNRKATCESRKKPHHFLDFLFLKQHKINQLQQEQTNGEGSGIARQYTEEDGRTMADNSDLIGRRFPNDKQLTTRMAKPEPTRKTLMRNKQGSSVSSVLPSFRPISFEYGMIAEDLDNVSDEESGVWEPIRDLHLDDGDDQHAQLLSNFADFWFDDYDHSLSFAGMGTAATCANGNCGICFHHHGTMTPAASPVMFGKANRDTISMPSPATPAYMQCVSPASPGYVQPLLIPPSVTSDSHDHEAHAYWSPPPLPLFRNGYCEEGASSSAHGYSQLMPLETRSHTPFQNASGKLDDDLYSWAEHMGLMMDANN